MPVVQRQASGEVFKAAPSVVATRGPSHLSRFTMLFHARKTLRLVRAVLADSRVPALRKGAFLLAICMLVLVLLVPDAASTLASLFLPVIGPLIDLPADAALDWTVAITLAPWLLRLLPPEIVAEHQAAIFGGG